MLFFPLALLNRINMLDVIFFPPQSLLAFHHLPVQKTLNTFSCTSKARTVSLCCTVKESICFPDSSDFVSHNVKCRIKVIKESSLQSSCLFKVITFPKTMWRSPTACFLYKCKFCECTVLSMFFFSISVPFFKWEFKISDSGAFLIIVKHPSGTHGLCDIKIPFPHVH